MVLEMQSPAVPLKLVEVEDGPDATRDRLQSRAVVLIIRPILQMHYEADLRMFLVQARCQYLSDMIHPYLSETCHSPGTILEITIPESEHSQVSHILFAIIIVVDILFIDRSREKEGEIPGETQTPKRPRINRSSRYSLDEALQKSSDSRGDKSSGRSNRKD